MDPAKCPSHGNFHPGSYYLCIPYGLKRRQQSWSDQRLRRIGKFPQGNKQPCFCHGAEKHPCAVVGISTLLGFILAILLNNEFKGRKLARAVVVFPWATTLIVQASIWKFIIDTDYGTLNTLLMKLGIIDHAVNWTPTAGAYFAWEIACGIFVTIPFVTFTVLSGLQSIDASYYEAAAVDGASYWQKMFQITIPLVRPNLTISTILNIIYVFNSFPIIWTITKGDPANRTDTLVTYLYKLAFYNGKQGQAAAVSVIGFLILLFCASLYMVSVLKKGDE